MTYKVKITAIKKINLNPYRIHLLLNHQAKGLKNKKSNKTFKTVKK